MYLVQTLQIAMSAEFRWSFFSDLCQGRLILPELAQISLLAVTLYRAGWFRTTSARKSGMIETSF